MRDCLECKYEDTNYKDYPCNTCKYCDDDALKLMYEPKEKLNDKGYVQHSNK